MVVKNIGIVAGVLVTLFVPLAHISAALSCSITTAAACTSPSVVVVRMSGSSNAHAELPSQSTSGYASNVICCSGVSNMGTSCSGTFATAVKLSATTNAHAQQSSQTGYANSVCLSVPAGGSVTIGYQASNCSGYETTLGSLSAATNAQIGNSSAFTTKICGSAAGNADTLSFSISDPSIGFGPLSAGGIRYATGDLNGSATQVEAHTMAASTTATSGYTITVQGATLASGGNTITAIGSSNTAPVAGIEQFGLRFTSSGGSPITPIMYADSGFAYDATATTTSTISSTFSGDGQTTTYSLRYVGNIDPLTESGTYTTGLTYTIVTNF